MCSGEAREGGGEEGVVVEGEELDACVHWVGFSLDVQLTTRREGWEGKGGRGGEGCDVPDSEAISASRNRPAFAPDQPRP